jgi:beta-mannosidase
LWWNLIDGWPQISDAVVDWYQCKKLAYHYIKRSQKPLCLMFDEPKDGKLSLYAVNDLSTSQTVRFTVTDLTNGRVLYSEKATVDGDVSKCVVSIPECKDYAFLYVEWETDKGIKGSNHYITKSRDISLEQYFRDIEKAKYNEFDGFDNEI